MWARLLYWFGADFHRYGTNIVLATMLLYVLIMSFRVDLTQP
jgi:hypothetical protein